MEWRLVLLLLYKLDYFSIQSCQAGLGQEMAEADDELEKIYSRIRELESSIVTLGEILGLRHQSQSPV